MSCVLLTEEPQFGRVKQMNRNSTGLHGNARSFELAASRAAAGRAARRVTAPASWAGAGPAKPHGPAPAWSLVGPVTVGCQWTLPSSPKAANLTGRLPAVAPARAVAALCLRMSAASGPWGRTEVSCVFYLTGSSLGDAQSSIPAIPHRACQAHSQTELRRRSALSNSSRTDKEDRDDGPCALSGKRWAH